MEGIHVQWKTQDVPKCIVDSAKIRMVDIHVNGVAGEKPRLAVFGGVVRNWKGELLSFPRPDEFKSLNEAELSATGHDLLIPKNRFMDQQFTIAGNSKNALDQALKEEHP